jgi:hypothetical protein
LQSQKWYGPWYRYLGGPDSTIKLSARAA